jgi:recombination protein RecR
MHHYPPSIRNAVKCLSRLPGIGEKTAERLAMHLLRTSGKEVGELARSISDLKEKTRICSVCHGLSDGEICGICSDPGRDDGLVCVVEQPADMISLEKSGSFAGRYHILQGVLSPMDGVGPDDIRIEELLSRVKTGSGQIREVILATGTDVNGESTAAFIAQLLAGSGIRITRIASGVPIGGDLKYIDQVTLKHAMDGRHAF